MPDPDASIAALVRNLHEAGAKIDPALSGWLTDGWTELSGRVTGLREAPPSSLAVLAAHLGPPLAELRAADLLLTSLCLQGDAPALAHFDQLLVREVSRAVRPLDEGNTLVDEVAQQVREKLLVGAGGGPLLASYAGQGSLTGWLRAVAVRTALNARRPAAREAPVSTLPDHPLADPDPELALLRARYRELFRVAFAGAIAALSPRERTILRLTSLDGLTLAQVAPMYGKDLSTISRWLSNARESLLNSTRTALTEVLGVSRAELDSVMRAADSELNLSLARLLESEAAE